LARATGEEGSIHNGYLSNMFYYGIPAFLFFILMIFSAMRFYLRLARVHYIYAIPFLFGFVYMMANLTNSFLPHKYVALLFSIQLAIFGGVLQNRLFPLPSSQSASPES
ncbi:MAG: hypothetical protein AAGM67_21655, partial [Bacteroidota bacterium]